QGIALMPAAIFVARAFSGQRSAHFNLGAEVVSQNASARTARPVLKVIGPAAGRATGTKGSTRG
ncbi:MAG: hypothetical protein Q8K85_18640, partial [Hyphomicrobium sp.]|nr:hypothetical protein [Hyphomicrobium sp.]